MDKEGSVELLDGVEVSADTGEVECWREWKWLVNVVVIMFMAVVVVITEGPPFFPLKTNHDPWYDQHASSPFLAGYCVFFI